MRLLSVLLWLSFNVSSPAADTLSETLQKGLFEEEANHNLDAAIKAYQAVLQQTDEQRKFAATAIFRLGECYRKQGKTNEAAAQYERVLQEFSGETALVTLSRQNLTGLGLTPKEFAPRGLSKAARSEQKRLIEEEIKLTDQELQRVTEFVKQGVATQGSLVPLQRDLLGLRRQLAGLALEVDETGAGTGITSQPAAAGQERAELDGIKAIIKDSPDLINARDRSGAHRTRLLRAAEEGYVIVAHFLLANGAEVDALDSMNYTPLHLAAMNGHKALVELLLANKAAVDGKLNPTTPLHLAASNGHKLVVEVLLAHGANVNARTKVGWTPLFNAVVHGYKAVAELLIENKADVNAASTEQTDQGFGSPNIFYPAGSSPLHIAASQGEAEMGETLCAHGANVNAKTKDFLTPLHNAAASGSKALVELLLARNADIAAKSSGGNTPLLVASRYPNADVVDTLLKRGADVNAQDEEHHSPVHEAVNRKSESVLRVLLTDRPNLQALDHSGWAPLQRAILNNNSERLVEMLLEAGASPEVYEKATGKRPLHWAAEKRAKQLVEMLLTHKANVNVQDNNGQTPYDLVKLGPGYSPATADELARAEIADLLRKAGASEDLLRLSSISISRKERGWNHRWFFKGTKAYNRYTLLELISNFFENRDRDYSTSKLFPFPDFSNIKIHRLGPQDALEEIKINLEEILHSGDCSKDVLLAWGDEVELPEYDHTINEPWSGLNEGVRNALRRCVERKVEIVVKGQITKITLRPKFVLPNGGSERETTKVSEGIVLPAFTLRNIVYGSNLLLTSSDVTRVKVQRKDPASGKEQEMLFNLANQTNPKTDLWLRDGDVIEVPEK